MTVKQSVVYNAFLRFNLQRIIEWGRDCDTLTDEECDAMMAAKQELDKRGLTNSSLV